MFSKIRKQFEVFRKLNTSENRRADIELLKSRVQNNPSFALINAWAILEDQVKKVDMNGYWNADAKSKFIISFCKDKLRLNISQEKRMESISQMRNGVAHAIPERKIPSWSDVDFITNISRRLRLKRLLA